MQEATWSRIESLLKRRRVGDEERGLYTEEQLASLRHTLDELATWLAVNKPAPVRRADLDFDESKRFSERDVVCIAYPDHVRSDSKTPPARALQELFNRHLAGSYSRVHVLPHFPSPQIHDDLTGAASRADGGFEPECYRMDPQYGRPEDIQALRAGLMFDFVLNHQSVRGEWFQKFLAGDPDYQEFFLTIPPDKVATLDLAPVFRPRVHHPVVPFRNDRGEEKLVWCTFSETQADLNFDNPRVLEKVMEALVKDFIGQGASWIRLDAVGYLVKQLGIDGVHSATSCFGLEETHDIIKAMNAYLGDVAPSATLIAEVNAGKDVIATYFGRDNDEAHMAYEFPVPPLSLLATYTGNTAAILAWAEERAAHPQRIGLAFTSSHDGIGVLPLRDVHPLPDGRKAIDAVIEEASRRGAGVNQKSRVVDGEQRLEPYEVCTTWAQAILTPEEQTALGNDALDAASIDHISDRWIASQSYALVAPHAVPADYLGAIAGLMNDDDTAARTRKNRDKNRGQVDAEVFARALAAPQSSRDRLVAEVFRKKARLLAVRKSSAAFSPYARCRVGVADAVGSTPEHRPVFSMERTSPDAQERVVTLTNASDTPQRVVLPRELLGQLAQAEDLVSGKSVAISGGSLELELRPHQVAWIRVGAR